MKINLLKATDELRIAFFAYRKELKAAGRYPVANLTTFAAAWHLAKATDDERKEHFKTL
jgi:hypothetical protein